MSKTNRLNRLLATPFLYPFIHMPGKTYRGVLPELTALQRVSIGHLRVAVSKLAEEFGERNTHFPDNLGAADRFITEKFIEYGWTVEKQPMTEFGVPMNNIIAEIKGTERPDEIVVNRCAL